MLPQARGVAAPLTCLNEARYGIVWGVTGAARSAWQAAADYAPQRERFGRLNLASVPTYEGSTEMHTLALGQALTGHAAFR